MKKLLLQYYEKRGFTKEETAKAVESLEDFFDYLQSSDIDEVTEDDIDDYIALLVSKNTNTIDTFLALARYFYLIDNKDIYIHFTKYLGGLGVIENIKDRINKHTNNLEEIIFDDIAMPVLGTKLDEISFYTEKLINKIEENLTKKELRLSLAGNNHNMPIEPMLKEKGIYENSESLDKYLEDFYVRKIEELQYHYDNNLVWYEQKISKKVLDYVKSNQEILSAVRVDDKLYSMKIPYDIEAYLDAKTDEERAYYLCHCPFARESVKNDKVNISKNWCYCSAGYAKFQYDIIFETELPVKVLKSALNNDGACRFEIDISGINYK